MVEKQCTVSNSVDIGVVAKDSSKPEYPEILSNHGGEKEIERGSGGNAGLQWTIKSMKTNNDEFMEHIFYMVR